MNEAGEVLSTSNKSRWLPWPKRVDIAILSFFALLIALCDRLNMSVAAPLIMREYQWDTVEMGWALSGFFVGYVALMVPAGMLADRYGPKRILAASVALWSIFTALTPLPRSLAGLSLFRVLVGAGESGTLPCMNGILARWFPRQEYSRAAGFCWSGGYAGPIVGFPLATAIVGLWGWRSVFIVFAFLGLIWLPLWWWGSSDRPELSPAIRKSELDYIVASRPDMPPVSSVPWGKLLKLPALWAVIILHFSSNWTGYVLLSWLPAYLLTERGFSLEHMALGTSLPFVAALIGTNIFGALIDRFSRGRDRTRIRKLFLLPYALAGVGLVLLQSASSPMMTVVTLCVVMASLSASPAVYSSSSLDLAPRYAGTFVAIQNSFANLAGVVAPVAVGYAVKMFSWDMAFWLTAGVVAIGILAYLTFGTTKLQVE